MATQKLPLDSRRIPRYHYATRRTHPLILITPALSASSLSLSLSLRLLFRTLFASSFISSFLAS